MSGMEISWDGIASHVNTVWFDFLNVFCRSLKQGWVEQISSVFRDNEFGSMCFLHDQDLFTSLSPKQIIHMLFSQHYEIINRKIRKSGRCAHTLLCRANNTNSL